MPKSPSNTHIRKLLAEYGLPKNFTDSAQIPDLPPEDLESYQPTCDSLKLKKHLYALHLQTHTLAHTSKAIMTLVELTNSKKPEVARRAAMSILKLSQLDNSPDLYPLEEDFFFDDEEETEPKKKRKKSLATTGGGAAAVQTPPPATPPEKPTTPNILHSPLPHSEFPQFTLTTPAPPPYAKTLQSLYPLAHFLILIFILILILRPTHQSPAQLAAASKISEFITHNSEFPPPLSSFPQSTISQITTTLPPHPLAPIPYSLTTLPTRFAFTPQTVTMLGSTNVPGPNKRNPMSDELQIRNFCIIAHIDHGKSTLADRLLERTGAITQREMEAQFLDDMDLEKERGITIKASAVSVSYTHPDTGQKYMFNLIDTPGHVDFHYEVAKALQACEGALLLCDATQGVQAQTVANAYAAIDQNLEIIPVINKVDLPSARPDEVAEEMEQVLGIDALMCAPISAKTGQGVDNLLKLIAEKLPGPKGDKNAPLQALIFDSKYDDYRGVVVYVRVMNGVLVRGQKIRMMGKNTIYTINDLGKFMPKAKAVPQIGTGEVGFIIANIKTIQDVTIGDTVADANNLAIEPLKGYREPQQMVFCDFYPGAGTEYTQLREALEKLRLNDSSFTFEPETSDALGFGFRCGFLGLLHMEIVQERLEREHKIEVIQTAPTVPYEVVMPDDSVKTIDSASELPDPSKYKALREPMIKANIIIPAKNIGDVTQLCIDRRGLYIKTDYITPDRIILEYEMPLAEIIFDFFDKLKTATQGYGTLDYELIGFHEDDLVKMDILVAGDKISALSLIVHRSKAEQRGRAIIKKLKQEIDRHLFEVALQASIGSRVIARETISALRKDVTSKCYGGDISRKRKLLEKQKEGKKRMKQVGRVEIPQEAFMSILESGD